MVLVVRRSQKVTENENENNNSNNLFIPKCLSSSIPLLLLVLFKLILCAVVQGFTPIVHHTQHQRNLVSTASSPAAKYLTLVHSQLPTTFRTPNMDDTATTTTTAAEINKSEHKSMRYIQGLQEIVNDYDVFLIDMWGVLHDGEQPYEYVLRTIQQLKDQNKILILLSNSSKRYQNSITNLQQLGFHCDDFHTIITSGEVTFQMLSHDSSSTTTTLQSGWEPLRAIMQPVSTSTSTTTNRATNKNVFILGSGDDDVFYCTSCGWTPVSNIDDAHLILARGPFTIPSATESDTVIDRRIDGEDIYQQTLQNVLQIAALKFIPMIVSNPDKVRPDIDRSPMPGQIGDLYESIIIEAGKTNPSLPVPPLSSLVKRIGKPFPDVYAMALQRISDVVSTDDKSRICMIGDALETDIVGGTMFGIDTVWVLNNGVHKLDVQKYMDTDDNTNNNGNDLLYSATQVLGDFNNNNVGTYAQGQTLAPTIVIPYFQW